MVTSSLFRRILASTLLTVFAVQVSQQQASAAPVTGVYQQSTSTQGPGREGYEPEYSYGSQSGSGAGGSYTSPGGYANIQTGAGFGALSLNVNRVSPVYPGVFTGPYGYSVGRAYWLDVVQIDATNPALNGTAGKATVSFTISGVATGSGSSGVDWIQYRFLSGDANTVYDPYTGYNGIGAGILTTPQVYEVNFTFGQPFALSVTIEGRVGSILDQPGQAQAVLTQTWNGFQSVTTSGGTPVAYTTTSNSNADYSQPITTVPEPATAGLLAVSGVFLALRRRRNRQNG